MGGKQQKKRVSPTFKRLFLVIGALGSNYFLANVVLTLTMIPKFLWTQSIGY